MLVIKVISSILLLVGHQNTPCVASNLTYASKETPIDNFNKNDKNGFHVD